MPRKYYFERVERTAVIADNEEDARLELANLYETSEDFELTDVRDDTPDILDWVKTRQGA